MAQSATGFQFENTLGDFFDSAFGSLEKSELGHFFDQVTENSRKNGFVYPQDVNSPEDALAFLNGFVDLDANGHLKSDKIVNSFLDMDHYQKMVEGIHHDFEKAASGEDYSGSTQEKLERDSSNLMKNFVSDFAAAGGTCLALGVASAASGMVPSSGGGDVKALSESFKTEFSGFTEKLSKSTVKAFSDIKAEIIRSDEKTKKTGVTLGASVQRLIQGKLAQLNVNSVQVYKANATVIASGSAAMAATTQMHANTEMLQDSARNLEQIKSRTDMLNTKLSSLYYLLQSTPVKNTATGSFGASHFQPTQTYKELNGIRSNELMINNIESLSRAAKRIEKKVVGINNLETKAQSF